MRQAKTLAHLITDVGREEQSEAFDAQVAVTILSASHCMYLRVSVQVPNPLDVHDNQLVVGALECEVAKGLWGVAYMNILHEATVRVVLDVLAIDEVLQMVQWLVWSILELKDGYLEHVNLLGRIVAVVDFSVELGVHLQLGIVKIVFACDVLAFHVAFSYVVGRVLPRFQVTSVRQLFTLNKQKSIIKNCQWIFQGQNKFKKKTINRYLYY